MPTLSKATLRAYVLLETGEDYPADELSYKSEALGQTGEYIRFIIVRTHGTAAEAEVVLDAVYAKGGHSDSHMEREFIDRTAKGVSDAWAKKKAALAEMEAALVVFSAKVEKCRAAVEAAGYPT
jgi:hypothetical protein